MVKLRHYIHLFLSIFTDLYGLVHALFAQIQGQWFRNEFRSQKEKENHLCILGNGKSLSLVVDNLEHLKNYDFCVVNNSITTELFWKIKPKMYVFTDRDYHQIDREDIVEVRTKILEIDWPIGIYVPYHYPKWFTLHCEQNPNVTVFHYNTQQWHPELWLFKKLRMYLFRHGLAAPHCTNVVVAATYSSLLMRYKDIFLLGTEHSWMRDVHVNDRNEVILSDKHYYGTKERVWVDYDGKPIKIMDLCESLYSTFRSYWDLKEFSSYLGSSITNCTEGSYIDAFPRDKFETLTND